MKKEIIELKAQLDKLKADNKDIWKALIAQKREITWLHLDFMIHGIKLTDDEDEKLIKFDINNKMGVEKNPLEFLEELAEKMRGVRAQYISRECIIWAIKRALKYIKNENANE